MITIIHSRNIKDTPFVRQWVETENKKAKILQAKYEADKEINELLKQFEEIYGRND